MMNRAVFGFVHVLLLAAIVAGKEFAPVLSCNNKLFLAGERYVSTCEPYLLPESRGTLEYPLPNSRVPYYARNVDCTWKFQPATFLGIPTSCDRMVATVEFLDTEEDGDILEIIDSSTNRVLASLSGQSESSRGFPKQYVACSSELTIRFKSDNNWERRHGFKISYATDST